MPKYSGADWMARTAKVTPSPFGVRVANVVGQVVLGIYHYHDDLIGRRAPDWTNDESIIVCLSRELATFDGCELSSLLLCCQAAGIAVDICGHSDGLLDLIFGPKTVTIPNPTPELEEGCLIEDFMKRHRLLNLSPQAAAALAQKRMPAAKTAIRWAYWEAGFDGIDNILVSVPNSRIFGRIYQLAVDAHHARLRLSVGGLSPSSVRIQLSRRPFREGRFYDRHPTWEQHVDLLRPLWDIDFDSTT